MCTASAGVLLLSRHRHGSVPTVRTTAPAPARRSAPRASRPPIGAALCTEGPRFATPSSTVRVDDDDPSQGISESPLAESYPSPRAYEEIGAILRDADRNGPSALRALAGRPQIIAQLWAALLALHERNATAYAAALARISPNLEAGMAGPVGPKRAMLVRAIRTWLDRNGDDLENPEQTLAELMPCWAFDRYGTIALDAFAPTWGSRRDHDANWHRQQCFSETLRRSLSPATLASTQQSLEAIRSAITDVAPMPDNGSVWFAFAIDVEHIVNLALWSPAATPRNGDDASLRAAVVAAERRGTAGEVPENLRARMRQFQTAQQRHLPALSRGICERALYLRAPLTRAQCDERARAASNAALRMWLRHFVEG